MVEFTNVSKVYDGNITAVDNVSFSIKEGEFIFLIGPSGSGKTTIIKMLIRDELPSTGKIFFDDVDITKITRRKVYKLRREIGVIFQDFKLIPDKTAYENVAFAMEAAGKSTKEIKETVPYVLDIVGLSSRLNSFPRQLSGGEQQRVAIARAISNNPKILIADEPTGNLDPASAWDIVQVLTKINNWGTTVIMSTHGTDIVNSLNKRVVQMEGGKIIRDDNKGQYEMVSKNFEKLVLDNEDTESKAKKKSKKSEKKSFKLKIDDLEEKLPEDSSVIEIVEEIQEKPKKGFFGFLGHFKRDEKITDVLDKSYEEIYNSEKKEVKEVDEVIKEDTEIESEEIVDNKNEENVEVIEEKEIEVKEEVDEKEVDETDNFLKKYGELSINELDIPKSIKKDLNKSGYKTVGSILEAGPEKLSEDMIIDKKEIQMISKAIKKLKK